MAFLPYPVIDLYIRAFVSGSQPHSGHRYFIDLRPNTPGHLWLGFALSSKGTVAGADSRLQRAVSVAGNTSRFFQRSIKGSVSGRYPVIPLLGISVRKAIAFPSLLPLCRKIPRRVCMRQRVAALSKGAKRLYPIEGLPPDPSDLPKGCSFKPRCPYAAEECGCENIPLVEITPGHFCCCSRIKKEEVPYESGN